LIKVKNETAHNFLLSTGSQPSTREQLATNPCRRRSGESGEKSRDKDLSGFIEIFV
jgi:hypothetical protein